jgi:plastocyanin
MPAPRLALAFSAAALAALAAGCGSDDDEPARTVTVGGGERLAVTAREYSYDPAAIVVTDGGQTTLTVALRNDGSLAHDLRVERDGQDVGGTPIFAGGETRTAVIPLTPGEYTTFCSVGNHRQLGMEGKLEVR